MSKKIEKKLHEAADKEHKEILDSNKLFFDDVLMPMFKEKKQKAVITTNNSLRSKCRRYGLLSAPLAVIVIAVTVLLFVFLPKDPTYLGPFNTEPSNIQTVNQCLIKTKLNGEFETIIRSSHSDTEKTMCFTVSHQITTDSALIQSNIELIIERSLTFDFEKRDYQNRLDFLGYKIKYDESISQSTFEDIPVFEFNIAAYLDTGKERFFITYYEISVNEYSTFAEYLTILIQIKN